MKKSTYTVVVIDDEENCIQDLIKGLSAYNEFAVVGYATKEKEAINIIRKEKPSVLFLDIELREMSGFELLAHLKQGIDWEMSLVFYTAHQHYLLEAIRAAAFDVLLKPFTIKDLAIIIDRIRKKTIRNNVKYIDARLSLMSSLLEKKFIIPVPTGYRIAGENDIVYFKYATVRKSWEMYLSDNNRILLKRNINACDILAYSNFFVQINQQEILNINFLSSIDGNTCSLIPPCNKHLPLKISRVYFKTLQEKFMAL